MTMSTTRCAINADAKLTPVQDGKGWHEIDLIGVPDLETAGDVLKWLREAQDWIYTAFSLTTANADKDLTDRVLLDVIEVISTVVECLETGSFTKHRAHPEIFASECLEAAIRLSAKTDDEDITRDEAIAHMLGAVERWQRAGDSRSIPEVAGDRV